MNDLVRRSDVNKILTLECSPMVAAYLIESINSLPLADVEVVRCKNCKYYSNKQKNLPWTSNRMYCTRSTTLSMNPDDFCSRGERREDGSNN